MNFYYSDFEQDSSVNVVTAGINSGNGGYFVWVSSSSGGYQEVVPMRLDTTKMVVRNRSTPMCPDTNKF
jgi:hypothetical protein